MYKNKTLELTGEETGKSGRGGFSVEEALGDFFKLERNRGSSFHAWQG